MRVGRRYLIAGRVQGVGFRVFTEVQAAVEGLEGWVRNLPDGRVEAQFEGDEAAVQRAEAKLRRGPAGADVQSVDVSPVVPGDRSTGFTIRG
jgi:acylphosphatase